MFSNVPMHRVFSMHDRESIYVIPDALRAEGLDREVLSILDLHGSSGLMLPRKIRLVNLGRVMRRPSLLHAKSRSVLAFWANTPA